MIGSSPSAPLVCGVAVAAALVVGAWFHPTFERGSKGASADAAPMVVASDLPPAAPPIAESTPTAFAVDPVDPIDAQGAQPPALLTVAPTAVAVADTSIAPEAGISTVAAIPTTSVVGPSPVVAPGPFHRSGGVPILMYHYIRINPVALDRAGFVLSVTPTDFALQMHLLASHGFSTVTMAQVRDFVRTGRPLPPKPIAVTLDDGYDDAYSAALPVLQRNGQSATFYVVTGFVGMAHYMTWDQVLGLDRDGMEIGSHTVHHAGLPLLSGLARRSELTNSQQELQGRLGHPILDFCYPGGQVDAATEIAVGQSGYLSATTTAFGFANVGDDPLRLPRVRVSGGEGLAEFAKILGEPIAPADLLGPVVEAPSLPKAITPTPSTGRTSPGIAAVPTGPHPSATRGK